MQFADYVIGSALETLSRCLRKAGERDGYLQAGELKFLRQAAQQLAAFWRLWQGVLPAARREVAVRAREDLAEIGALTVGSKPAELAAAERLLERADPKAAGNLRLVMAELAEAGPGQDHRERITTLLQAESARWRAMGALRATSDADLVERGMLRAVRKARKENAVLDARWDARPGKPPGVKRLLRAGRWAGCSASHLELLRPALSDAGKRRHWHLSHLAAKLEEQWALERLARTAAQVDLKPKASIRLGKLIRRERKRLEMQRRKLAQGAFAGGVKAYREEVTDAVARLGLKVIVLLPQGGSRVVDEQLEEQT